MNPLMEAVPALEAHGETPPLAAARMRRRLTVESAAKLARLTPDEVTWLEEGRLYLKQMGVVRDDLMRVMPPKTGVGALQIAGETLGMSALEREIVRVETPYGAIEGWRLPQWPCTRPFIA